MSQVIDPNCSLLMSQARGISLDHKRFLTLKQDQSIGKLNDSNRYITDTQREHFLTELPLRDDRFHSLSPIQRRHDNSILPSLKPAEFKSTKTLVLDLDETLIHSSFNQFAFEADISLKLDTDNQLRDVYVLVRPYLDEFLNRVSICFDEIIIFTASLPKYANPIIDIIDKEKVIKHRLFREQCTWVNNTFVKELKRLNRNMKNVVILDNNPYSFCLDPDNGIPIKSFYEDKNEKELIQMAYILEKLSKVGDVPPVINEIIYLNQINYDKAFELFKHKAKEEHEGESNNKSKAVILTVIDVKVNNSSLMSKKMISTPIKECQIDNTTDCNNENNAKNTSGRDQFTNKKQLKTKTGGIVPVTNITLSNVQVSKSFNRSNSKEAQKASCNNNNQIKKVNLFNNKENRTLKYEVKSKKGNKSKIIRQTKEKQFEQKKISKSLTYTSLNTIRHSHSKPKMSSAKSNINIMKQTNLNESVLTTPQTEKKKNNGKTKSKNITIRAIRAQSFLNKVNSIKAQSTKYISTNSNNNNNSNASNTLNSTATHFGKTKSLNLNSKKDASKYNSTHKHFYHNKKSITTATNTPITSVVSSNLKISKALKESNDYHNKKYCKDTNKTPLNKKQEKSLFSSSTTKKINSELKILQIIPTTAKISLNRSKTSLNCSFQSGAKKEAIK